MSSSPNNPRCEEHERLCEELAALKTAVQKAHQILGYTTDSPDTLRRRRNSIVRWNQVYAEALQKLEAHTREHKCTGATASPAS